MPSSLAPPSPILGEARALLADLLLDVLPPDHEISVIMRTGVMSGTSAATADAQLLEELWRLSQQVNPGESTWPVVSRFKFSTSAQAVLSLTDSPSHAVPAPTDILLAAFAYGAVSGGVGRSMLKTLARRRGLQVDELIDRTQSELGGRMTPRLLGKPQRTAISPVWLSDPSLITLSDRAASYAARTIGRREIHVRHLAAAAMLADGLPVDPAVLAALGTTADELPGLLLAAVREGPYR